MQNVKKIYQEAYNRHGLSLNSIFIPKGRQAERFESLCLPIKSEPFTILDYGCGFGDLYLYLKQHYKGFTYTGVDIVPPFISECKTNIPEAQFQLIQAFTDIKQSYDFIAAVGVFNLLYCEDIEEHKQIVKQTITHLFEHTTIALLLNFMSDQVDFQQKNSYHQNIPELYNFVVNHLSSRFILDQSYMPYEFSILIYKDARIIRPDNIYPSLK